MNIIIFFKEQLKKFDKNIKNLIFKGLKFCFNILIVSSLVLITYIFFYNSPELYYIGLSIFQMGITFISSFIFFGIAFNELKKQFN